MDNNLLEIILLAKTELLQYEQNKNRKEKLVELFAVLLGVLLLVWYVK